MIDKKIISEVVQVIVSIVLLVSLTPMILLISLLIKFNSKGDIFFRQERVGLNGAEFTIYKFRTFRENTKTLEPSPSNSNDTRLTSIGSLLRKYSLDELPQLLNVIKRDINIIGPRAIVFDALSERCAYLICEYPEKKEEYLFLYFNKRQTIRPGITGLTQVSGRSVISVEDSLNYDIEYIDRWSLFLDIKIIFKTFRTVFLGKDSN